MDRDSPPTLLNRRRFLQDAFLGACGLTLFSGWRAWGEASPPAGKAKAVIQLWMWGGPSHLDTFDPKPEAGYDYCGPWNAPIETNVPGTRICQYLPLLAQQADKYSLIRSMTHGDNGHETAAYATQTGHRPGGGIIYPALGAIAARFRGYQAGYTGLVPPYIVLTQPLGRFDPAGFLGPLYEPFTTGGDPNAKQFAVEGIVSEGITEDRQRARRALLGSLDSLPSLLPQQPQFQKLETSRDKAYDMILGDAGKLFDLAQEPDALRDKYGRTSFGQSCLMARRLVQAGVPSVTINYNAGWDTHKKNFETLRRVLPVMDKGMSALLQDLADHYLLDSTIVWWSGEFGRTPKIDWAPPWDGGRGHWGQCFSAVVAGGGFKGGQVVGASDAKGEYAAQRPVSPQDLLGSILELMGIDPDGPMPNARGLDLKVMPDEEKPSEGAGRLKEIM
jgi:hypothetical protein